MRLKHFAFCNFRATEETNTNKMRMTTEECALLVSIGRDQFMFVKGKDVAVIETSDGRTKPVTVLPSQKYRVIGKGHFEPKLINHYAEQAGITLDNYKSFEKFWEDQRKRRIEERRQRLANR